MLRCRVLLYTHYATDKGYAQQIYVPKKINRWANIAQSEITFHRAAQNFRSSNFKARTAKELRAGLKK